MITMAVDFGFAFLYTYLVVLVLFGGFYAWALFKKRYNSVDIAFGVAFPLAAIMMGFFGGNFFTLNKIIATLLLLIWGARIAVMLTLRNYGKDEESGEDRRFKSYRDKFGASASWKGFLFLYFPQTILVMVVGFPAYAINYSTSKISLAYLIGIIIWAAGFAFELVADLQMWKFKREDSNKGKIMQSGLWKYSMHPNYFGEILQWTGFFALGLTSSEPWYQVIGLLSPITIWASLMFLSGIPLQDIRFKEIEAYQEYRRMTNRLIPWFKKSPLSRKD
jgi:steroid 5-alpha reductase family enzyme